METSLAQAKALRQAQLWGHRYILFGIPHDTLY
ncbi:hypothetical protein F0726_00004 [Acidithiobacillus caldus]|nr:hypothetical protein F0726_00004 [Acidithiobacillus caldus]